MRAVLAGVLLMWISVPATFAAGQYSMTGMMQPGLWKTTVRTSAGHSNTGTECVTPEQISDFSAFSKSDPDQKVTIQEFKRDGKHLHYKMNGSFGQATMTMQGDLLFPSPQQYSGTIKLAVLNQGKPHETDMQVEGTRIGDCKKGSSQGSD